MAAPTPTDSATMGTVLDFPRTPRAAEHEPTPQQLLDEFTRAEAAFEAAFLPAVRRTMLAELATWPKAFHALAEDIESRDWVYGPGGSFVRDRWQRFAEGRGWVRHEHSIQGCGCGCGRFNDRVADHLKSIRAAGAELRAFRGKPLYAQRRRRADLQWRKHALLETMFWNGQRRIDRGRLLQHAAESLRTEAGRIRMELERGHRREHAAECRARLRANVFEKGPRKGQPLTEARRAELAAGADYDGWAAGKRARLAEIEQLLANPLTLAREWTGCTRSEA